ncbi:MAG: SDR family NAD(P)-dependent oxidoreductase [Promethearchaeota archaeon]
MKKLKNKNCLITGAASGIGRSLAVGLAKEGMNLFLSDINMDNLEKVKEEIEAGGVKVYIGRCDVSKYEEFENLSSQFYSKFRNLDFLINNAGIGGGGYTIDLELEDWKRILDVNLWSIIYSIKVFLPRMLERGSGHIINVGSGAGIVGLSCHLHYIASKFAVVGISEGLYSELSNKGIDVSVICPTHIKSNIIERSSIGLPKNIVIDDDADPNQVIDNFKREFWKGYMEVGKGLTPDEAAVRYIKGIKKNKLYIFDKKILPVAMFIKGISKNKLYKKVLRKIGTQYNDLINSVLSKLGIEYKS